MKKRVILAFLSLCCFSQAVWAVPVSVEVVDENGQAVPDADLYLAVENLKSPTARTDATGRHSFEAPTEENSWIGHIVVKKSGLALGGTNLKKGENKVVLPRATSVSGVVTDDGGAPLAGVEVKLQSMALELSKKEKNGGFGPWISLYGSPIQTDYTVQTGANGAFRFEGIPSDAEAHFSVVAAGFAARNVKIKSGESQTIALARGTILRGQVLDEAGNPLAGVKVRARDMGEMSHENSQSGETDAQGRYEILGLIPATFRLVFEADKNSPLVFPSRSDVVARMGEVVQVPVVSGQTGIVFRGKVLAANDQKPIKGATISVRADWMEKNPRTDENGEFSVRTLPGKHRIYLASYRKGFKNVHREREVFVEANSEPFVLELERAQVLRGQIVDENGAPVQATVHGHANYDSFPIKAGEDGKFEADVTLEGKFQLRGRSAHGFRHVSDWEVVSPREVAQDAQGEIKIVVRRAEKHELTGQAQDENGVPLAGATLQFSLSYENTGTSKSVTTDENGRFSLEFNRDVKVSFSQAFKDGYEWKSGGEVEGVAPKFVAKTVVFVVRDSQIAGRVTLEDGRAATGARVLVGEEETRADADGKYELKGLARGPKRVLAATENSLGIAPDGGDFVLKPFALPTKNTELARQILAEKPSKNELSRWWFFSETELHAKAREIIQNGGVWEQTQAASLMKTRLAPAEYLTLLEAVKSPAVRFYLLVDFLEAQEDPTPFAAQIETAKTLLGEAKNRTDWNWGIAGRWVALAAIIEKVQGTEAASQTLLEASQWIFRTFPETSQYDGDRTSVLGQSAKFVALSPALSEQLMGLLQVDDAGYTHALSAMAEVHARAGDFERAAQFLEQLRTAPKAQNARDGHVDNSWIHAQAALACVKLGAAKNPKVALSIARSIETRDAQRAEAIALVALELPLADARPLFREAIGAMPEYKSASFLRRLRAKDETWAREILKEIRAKVAAREADADHQYNRPKIAQFAFYEADFDAPSAYLRLEGEWAKATQKRWTDERYSSALAMAKLDPQRALEWAKILDAASKGERGRDTGSLFTEIARLANADDATRQSVNVSDWGGSFVWVGEENGLF